MKSVAIEIFQDINLSTFIDHRVYDYVYHSLQISAMWWLKQEIFWPRKIK